uniref:Uncharacterized protein n=1 Tax=Oryza glumipatula TaxID=40148 RepID=A0A0D9Z6I8_9ORYZ
MICHSAGQTAHSSRAPGIAIVGHVLVPVSGQDGYIDILSMLYRKVEETHDRCYNMDEHLGVPLNRAELNS